VIISPYDKKAYHTMLLGKPPAGVAIFKGEKSAYQSVRLIEGKKAPTKDIDIDMGIQDIELSGVGERKVGLRFTPDPKQLTTGDFSISRRTPSISPKVPRLK